MKTWVKIDDAMHLNAKVRSVSLAARWAYVAGICRSGATQSDGEILAGDLGLIDANPKIAKELVAAGLWETTSRGSFVVHDYLIYNRSRAQIEELSRTNAANGSAKRGANRLPNRTANGPSDSHPQNARSATSAGLSPQTPPKDLGEEYQQKGESDSQSDSLDEAVGRLCREWERGTGTTVTAMVGDAIASELERVPEDWIADAIKETGLANARSWKYTAAILQRWSIEGRELPPAPVDIKAEADVAKERMWKGGHIREHKCNHSCAEQAWAEFCKEGGRMSGERGNQP